MADLIPDFKIRSPEQIHYALPILTRQSWLILALLGALVLWAVAFMLLGRVPIAGQGYGMFLTRGTVIPFQATASGQIGAWYVNVGDRVDKGQLLASFEQPIIEKELEHARKKREDLEARNAVIKSLTKTYNHMKQATFKRKRTMLNRRIAVFREEISRRKQLVDTNYVQERRYLGQHEKDLSLVKHLNRQHKEALTDKLKRTEKLLEQGLSSKDSVLQDSQTLADHDVHLADLDLEAMQLMLNRLNAAEGDLKALDGISKSEEALVDLTQQLDELEKAEVELDEQDTSNDFVKQLEINDVIRTIELYEEQLAENRQLISQHDGRILELTQGAGKLVTKGTRLGAIDARDESSVLEAVAYFTLADGKKIKPGMKMRLTPATVQRERFGSLIAHVESVSNFPVTAEGVANVVGNASVAEQLTIDGHSIEVFAKLIKDENSFSGYLWDLSEGPEMKVTSGAQASVLVNFEERPPLTFVLPIFRDWGGF